MIMTRIAPFALAGLLAAAGGVAYAADQRGDEDRRDVAALAAMKVSLPQAIAAAEQQSGGRAVGADLSQDNGVTRIAVEIAGAQGIKTLLIDGQTGQVTGTRVGGKDDDHD